MKVLFVCRANAGRSQAAMEYYNRFRPGSAESAGTIVPQPGQKVHVIYGDMPFIAALKEDGINLLKNNRKPLEESMLKAFDRIVIMAQPETIPKYIQIGGRVEYWPVKDPKVSPLEEARSIRDEIKQRVEDLVERTASSRRPPLPVS